MNYKVRSIDSAVTIVKNVANTKITNNQTYFLDDEGKVIAMFINENIIGFNIAD